ncbi:Eosinophil granule major basic protein 2 [Heterocephalus glaber]|uniref:Eosinophil granule major basic protein 2 n=1 Tax=Heterocephalus glaber TaxID=10181 RepID=G5BLI9_HETGA|nr:Eosinophil granule major basic protein 2 [Heterocephalus glaber]
MKRPLRLALLVVVASSRHLRGGGGRSGAADGLEGAVASGAELDMGREGVQCPKEEDTVKFVGSPGCKACRSVVVARPCSLSVLRRWAEREGQGPVEAFLPSLCDCGQQEAVGRGDPSHGPSTPSWTLSPPRPALQSVCQRCYRGNLMSTRHFAFNSEVQCASRGSAWAASGSEQLVGWLPEGRWRRCFLRMDRSSWNFAYWAPASPPLGIPTAPV